MKLDILSIPEHQRKALQEGKSIEHDGRLVTLSDFGGVTVPGKALDAAFELETAKARVAELEAKLAEAGDAPALLNLQSLLADANGEVERLTQENEVAASRIKSLEGQLDGVSKENGELWQRFEALTAENKKLKEAKPVDDSKGIIEALIPDSKTGLERLTVEALHLVAKYRGLDPEGKDKAALVTALMEGL